MTLPLQVVRKRSQVRSLRRSTLLLLNLRAIVEFGFFFGFSHFNSAQGAWWNEKIESEKVTNDECKMCAQY